MARLVRAIKVSTTEFIQKTSIACIHVSTRTISCVRHMKAFQFTLIQKIPTGVGRGHGTRVRLKVSNFSIKSTLTLH